MAKVRNKTHAEKMNDLLIKAVDEASARLCQLRVDNIQFNWSGIGRTEQDHLVRTEVVLRQAMMKIERGEV